MSLVNIQVMSEGSMGQLADYLHSVDIHIIGWSKLTYWAVNSLSIYLISNSVAGIHDDNPCINIYYIEVR